MSLNIFLQPNNQFGLFLQLSLLKRSAMMLALIGGLAAYPCFMLWQQYAEHQQQSQQLQRLNAELQHQQRLIASLKHKQQQQLLTPQLTSQVAQLNQKLQHRKGNINILSSQWKFEQGAMLQLEVESYFTELRAFLEGFLQGENIALLSLEIERNKGEKGTISSHLVFQLQTQDHSVEQRE